LLEGESLFNDATAIVLFSLFLSMALAWQSMLSQPASAGVMFSVSGVVLEFLFIFFGGALIGLLVGVLFGFLEKRANQLLLTGVMSLVVAYGSFMLAEYFSVSGVMATLSAALSFSVISQSDKESPARLHTGENRYFWQLLSHVANVCVFLLMGAVITVEMFEQRWLAMLIAIVAILFARALSVYGVLAFFSFFKSQRVSLSAQTVMVWGGLRGAVTLALALSLPTTLDYWWTIQSIAFGVVLFSLFVQAPTMALLAKKILR